MNDVNTAPTTKIRIPMKRMNWEKRFDSPTVRMPSLADAMPTPILELKSKRKSVEATLRVRQAMIMLV
jgi:hypothetical protein